MNFISNFYKLLDGTKAGTINNISLNSKGAFLERFIRESFNGNLKTTILDITKINDKITASRYIAKIEGSGAFSAISLDKPIKISKSFVEAGFGNGIHTPLITFRYLENTVPPTVTNLKISEIGESFNSNKLTHLNKKYSINSNSRFSMNIKDVSFSSDKLIESIDGELEFLSDNITDNLSFIKEASSVFKRDTGLIKYEKVVNGSKVNDLTINFDNATLRYLEGTKEYVISSKKKNEDVSDYFLGFGLVNLVDKSCQGLTDLDNRSTDSSILDLEEEGNIPERFIFDGEIAELEEGTNVNSVLKFIQSEIDGEAEKFSVEYEEDDNLRNKAIIKIDNEYKIINVRVRSLEEVFDGNS